MKLNPRPTMDKEKVIKLLEEIKARCLEPFQGTTREEQGDESYNRLLEINKRIDKEISLLREPKCKICGDIEPDETSRKAFEITKNVKDEPSQAESSEGEIANVLAKSDDEFVKHIKNSAIFYLKNKEYLSEEWSPTDSMICEKLLRLCNIVKKLKGKVQRTRHNKTSIQDKYNILAGNKCHPENYCHQCGGKNISWYVNSELWNKVVPLQSEIWCPICFVKQAEKKGIKPTAWRLSREGDKPEIDELRTENSKLKDFIERIQVEIKALKGGNNNV